MRMLRWGRFAVAYGVLGVVASVIAVVWRDGSPLVHPTPWLALSPRVSHTYSLLLGLAFGGLVVLSTRPLVARFSWAKHLHQTLRPIARSMTTTGILFLAVLSAVG